MSDRSFGNGHAIDFRIWARAATSPRSASQSQDLLDRVESIEKAAAVLPVLRIFNQQDDASGDRVS